MKLFISHLLLLTLSCIPRSSAQSQLRGGGDTDNFPRKLQTNSFSPLEFDVLCEAFPDFFPTPLINEAEDDIGCGLIVEPGSTTTLSHNLVCDSAQTAIRLRPGAILDCNSFSITGNSNVQYQIGIWMEKGSSVQNCRLDGFQLGIYVDRKVEAGGTPSRLDNVQILNSAIFGINAADSITITDSIISRSGDVGLTASAPSFIDGRSTIDEIFVALERVSICNSGSLDIQIYGVNEDTMSMNSTRAKNTFFSNRNSEVFQPSSFTISDCNECFYGITEAPSSSHTYHPTAAPTQGPQRIRLLAGVQNQNGGVISGSQYLTIGGALCNRYIQNNPFMEIRPRRNNSDADTQIFIYHPDGLLESEACRGIYVSIAREGGRQCCTPESIAGESRESACAEGRIRLGTTRVFRRTGSSFGGKWIAHQTTLAHSSTGNIPFYLLQNPECPTARALSHDGFTQGEPRLGDLGNGFDGLLWGFEPVE